MNNEETRKLNDEETRVINDEETRMVNDDETRIISDNESESLNNTSSNDNTEVFENSKGKSSSKINYAAAAGGVAAGSAIGAGIMYAANSGSSDQLTPEQVAEGVKVLPGVEEVNDNDTTSNHLADSQNTAPAEAHVAHEIPHVEESDMPENDYHGPHPDPVSYPTPSSDDDIIAVLDTKEIQTADGVIMDVALLEHEPSGSQALIVDIVDADGNNIPDGIADVILYPDGEYVDLTSEPIEDILMPDGPYTPVNQNPVIPASLVAGTEVDSPYDEPEYTSDTDYADQYNEADDPTFHDPYDNSGDFGSDYDFTDDIQVMDV